MAIFFTIIIFCSMVTTFASQPGAATLRGRGADPNGAVL
jgi:hypothetical protein